MASGVCQQRANKQRLCKPNGIDQSALACRPQLDDCARAPERHGSWDLRWPKAARQVNLERAHTHTHTIQLILCLAGSDARANAAMQMALRCQKLDRVAAGSSAAVLVRYVSDNFSANKVTHKTTQMRGCCVCEKTWLARKATQSNLVARARARRRI